MQNSEALKKQEANTLNATKNIAKLLTAFVMLIATVAVVYIAS